MFKRILIANRGEIAVRVIRACRDLGIETVAVYSDADRGALHVREADYAVAVGPAPAAESYLNIDRILDAAKQTGAEAIHPGYGFFSENASFARAVEKAGMVWIGPPPEAIERMGDKVEARKLMAAAGVPVVPGSPGTLETEAQVRAVANKIGFPIMIKAAAGGGGKGMRLVESDKDLASAVRTVASEAKSSFGDGRFYVEKFVRSPRHIEVQVLADKQGNTVHLFERECSIQRRNQKVVEESPSPFVTPEMRKTMGAVAVKAAKAVDYLQRRNHRVSGRRGPQFLFPGNEYAHPGRASDYRNGDRNRPGRTQIEIAAGKPLPFKQNDIAQNGWAIECRMYAEDPAAGFVPAPGKIETLRLPEGPGVRNDGGVYAGAEVPMFYDPMISKLAAWGNRAEAIDRMRRALSEFLVSGTLTTNLEFHRWIMDHPRCIRGEYDTSFINEEFLPAPHAKGEDLVPARRDAAGGDRGAAQRESQPRPRRQRVLRNRPARPGSLARIDSLRR